MSHTHVGKGGGRAHKHAGKGDAYVLKRRDVHWGGRTGSGSPRVILRYRCYL